MVRRFLDDVVNGGNLGVLGELWPDDLAWHGGSMGDIRGLAAFSSHLPASAGGAFSDMRLRVHDMLTAGDKVVVRFANSGRQTGPFMGAPASGRIAEWLGIGIYQVTNGNFAAAWFGEDILGMMLQLGVIALPAPVSPPDPPSSPHLPQARPPLKGMCWVMR